MINPYLLSMQIIASSYPNENLPTSAAIFIFNDAFNIARQFGMFWGALY